MFLTIGYPCKLKEVLQKIIKRQPNMQENDWTMGKVRCVPGSEENRCNFLVDRDEKVYSSLPADNILRMQVE